MVLLVLALLRLVQHQAAQAALGRQQAVQAALGLQALARRRPLAVVDLVARLRLDLQQLAQQLVVHPTLGLQQPGLAALALLAALLPSVLVVGLVVHLQQMLAVVVGSRLGSKRLGSKMRRDRGGG